MKGISHIVADLLQLAIDGEWLGQARQGCHCHPEYVACCPECHALESEGAHEPGCKRMALIAESQAFLRVENQLAEERGTEVVYVP